MNSIKNDCPHNKSAEAQLMIVTHVGRTWSVNQAKSKIYNITLVETFLKIFYKPVRFEIGGLVVGVGGLLPMLLLHVAVA